VVEGEEDEIIWESVKRADNEISAENRHADTRHFSTSKPCAAHYLSGSPLGRPPRLASAVGVLTLAPLHVRRLPLHWWQRDAELEPRSVVGAKKDVIGEAERHHRFVGSVPLEQPFDVVGMLAHLRQLLLTQHGDDGAPVLPRERDPVHEAMIESRREYLTRSAQSLAL
jgi:hypothetical protein